MEDSGGGMARSSRRTGRPPACYGKPKADLGLLVVEQIMTEATYDTGMASVAYPKPGACSVARQVLKFKLIRISTTWARNGV